MRLSGHRRILGVLLACAPVLVDLISTGRADVIRFRDGGEVTGRVEPGGDTLQVVMPFGTFRLRSAEVREVVPGFDPAREWDARRAEAVRRGAPERLDAAWWALEHGLVEQAVGLVRETHRDFPSDTTAARIQKVLEALDREPAEADTTELEAAIGEPLRVARSRHIVLLHQHDTADARDRLDLLERVALAYYLWFGFHGVDLSPPPSRLPSVYLRRRATYLRFLESQDAGALRGTMGYYHPTLRAVVAYDLRDSGRWKESGVWRAQAGRSDDALPFERKETDARRVLLWESDYRANDLGTAAHELVHLLVVASGVSPTIETLPVWLHEGLATQFEVVRGGRWAGISKSNDLRLADLAKTPTPRPLLPVLRDDGFGRGYQPAAYARAWSLTRFLLATRPREVLTYIDLLGRGEVLKGESSGDRSLRVFRSAFGEDLGPLGDDWNRETTRQTQQFRNDRLTGPAFFSRHRD